MKLDEAKLRFPTKYVKKWYCSDRDCIEYWVTRVGEKYYCHDHWEDAYVELEFGEFNRKVNEAARVRLTLDGFLT